MLSTCYTTGQTNTNEGQLVKKGIMNNQEIINVAFFYLKKGQEKTFEKLRSRGNVLLEKYGARIERVIKPTMIAQGELELPNEIHFAVYPNKEALESFNKDPEFLALKEEVVAPSVEKMYGFVTKKTDFEFVREIGDNTKTYGIALIYFKQGEKYETQFAQYHDEACAIIPEFGTHFERFLLPIESKGELEKPNEIHRFYFDSQEGMKQMVSDERMQKLFPKRDGSLSNLIFILGEAIQ
ncbi:hypothetical protein C1H87_14650 [Flavivirga eckloniae]|uniref:DUF1330 domain-containing protein n=2 Tax=Flavivirga eckloniae TaxID=1803846 RepID=A0A2K9PTJ0_9FLAO|nr:hypothetical protein C1H87_14650 [Flavivirga eckloniae]